MRSVLRSACRIAACVLLFAGHAVADQPAPPAAPPSVKVPVEKAFKGRILKLEGREIEILYDFQDAAQLDDFELSIPFRAIRTVARAIENGQVRVTGTGSLRHKALFDKTAGATATLTPVKNKDFGLAVTEDRESEVFTLYCLYDRYFSAGDNVHIPQNMIIKFIPRDPKVNKDGIQDWRYCGSRGQKPVIERGRAYKVEVERGDNQSRFVIDDWEAKGKEAGRDLTSQAVALYAYDGDFKADDLVVRGSLEAGWVERNRIDLTTWKPPVDPDAGGATKATDGGAAPEVAARVRAKINGWPAETKPAEMAALLRDAKVPEELRNEAAQKAIASGQKRLVPYLVDGLYAEDEPSRRLASEVLTKLAGKNFGFRADAPDEQRKKAIQAVNEYLKKHATEFQ
jgi:hypothetical protein